jgi:4-aminobutyrate aminotransferase-like enzyme
MKKNLSIKTKNIDIKTNIPAPGTKKIISILSKYEARSMQGQLPIVWSKAKNFNIYDIADNKFIDFTSTIFVANIGHSNPRLKKYLKKALDNNLIHTYAYPNEIRANYLKRLIQFSGNRNNKAFLLSAGTEATEAGLKLMKLYGIKIKKRKLGIISFEGNWHGRTMGAQMISGNKNQKAWIGLKDKNIHFLPFPYPWLLKKKSPKKFLLDSLKILKKKISLKRDICGIMIETFQGWGAIFYPKAYIKALEKICKKNNILICFDEMQSGFARTGKKFGFQHYNIKPDLICCGKGMGAGVPVSGVIGRKDILDLPEVGNMSSTHSANPLACYAGLAVLDEIKEKNLLKTIKVKEEILFKYLRLILKENPESIMEISGKGLIAAIIFKIDRNQKIYFRLKEICVMCLKQGLLVVYTGRESIKIGPPLTISINALKEGLEILRHNIRNIFNK